MIRRNRSARTTINPRTLRPSARPYVPPSVARAIAARWRLWVPWVCMDLQRARQAAPTVNPEMSGPEFHRLRERHAEHILDLMRDGISMRSIRRHRMDDPRLTDHSRAMLVEAAKERQSKAWHRRPEDQRAEDRLARLLRLGPVVGRDSTRGPDRASPEGDCQPKSVVSGRLALPAAIESIRRLACERFYLRGDARPGAHGAHQSACVPPPATTGHVHRQAAHRRVTPGNRPRVRRPAPQHGAALRQQDRSDAAF